MGEGAADVVVHTRSLQPLPSPSTSRREVLSTLSTSVFEGVPGSSEPGAQLGLGHLYLQLLGYCPGATAAWMGNSVFEAGQHVFCG